MVMNKGEESEPHNRLFFSLYSSIPELSRPHWPDGHKNGREKHNKKEGKWTTTHKCKKQKQNKIKHIVISRIIGGKQDNYIVTKPSCTPPAIPMSKETTGGERKSQAQAQTILFMEWRHGGT